MRKYLLSIGLLATMLSLATVAFATEYTKTGVVSKVQTSAGSAMFFVWLEGVSPMCGSGTSPYAYIDSTSAVFREEVSRIALASKLSGKEVSLVVDSESTQCRITKITLNE